MKSISFLLFLILFVTAFSQDKGVSQPKAFARYGETRKVGAEANIVSVKHDWNWVDESQKKFFEAPYKLVIDGRKLENSKKWDPKSGKEPKTSIGDATQKVLKWLKTEFPDIKPWRINQMKMKQCRLDR